MPSNRFVQFDENYLIEFIRHDAISTHISDFLEEAFERLRQKAIQAGVEALELKPAGRPPKSSSPSDEQIAELQERVAELEAELQAATLKAELAATLPRLAGTAGKKP
jgi:hypothetical protein